MKWNGRYYSTGYGRRPYPPKEDSIEELLKPLSEKTKKGNVWIPVKSQILNVYKPQVSPPPPVETYYILTQSSDEIITQSGDNLIWLI